MKVHWTDTAAGHLNAIYNFIAQDSADYARHMIDRLTRKSKQIAEYPFSGRSVPEYELEQVREVFEGPFRILYYIKPDQIDILAIIHGAMNLSS